MKFYRLFFVLGLTLLAGNSYSGEVIKFKSLGEMNQYHVSGELYLPKDPGAGGKFPAMVVVHGTGGIDERTDYFAKELPKIGIAVFVVDYKNGVYHLPTDRPPNDSFIPASFAALKVLRERPEIDPARIGIMGFSLGGQQTLSTSLESIKMRWIGSDIGFAVHVAFYPGCKFFLRKINATSKINAPLQVFWGTDDSYGDGEYCPKLAAIMPAISSSAIDFVPFQGGHHGFDGDKTEYFKDPAATGPRAYIESNPSMGAAARKAAIAFLEQYLK